MREKILHRLMENQHRYLSGTELAEYLGVSRVAVWKHVEALKEEGYRITGISGKGYRLEEADNVLLPARVEAGMARQRFGHKILYYSQTDSTNRMARELLMQHNLPEGTLILAQTQTGGRGRRGKAWWAPPGGLWFTLVLRPAVNLHNAALLSLVFAVACVRCLQEYTDHPCGIKWPNDVMIDGRKVVGILLEASGEMDAPDYVIAGLGLNVNLRSEDWPEPVGRQATSLAMATGKTMDLNQVLIRLLSILEEDYDLFLHEGIQPFMEPYKSRCLHLGERITVHRGPDRVTGIHRDIEEDGSLVMETEAGWVHITAGDVEMIHYQEDSACT